PRPTPRGAPRCWGSSSSPPSLPTPADTPPLASVAVDRFTRGTRGAAGAGAGALSGSPTREESDAYHHGPCHPYLPQPRPGHGSAAPHLSHPLRRRDGGRTCPCPRGLRAMARDLV